MLLEKFIAIAELGATRPLILWFKEYKNLAREIVLELGELSGTLDQDTDIAKHVQSLTNLLKEECPNEFLLAKHLMYVSSLFSSNEETEDVVRELVGRYLTAVKKFYHLAQLTENHAELRRRLKDKLSLEEQVAYDLKLFQHEGMSYCLEFYLTLYKAIQDAPNESEKRRYIESTDVNLGFGQVPGLWADFNQDEALTKFIYSILDDDIRTKLTEAYFGAKLVIMKIHLNCDKQGKCEAVYDKVTPNQVIGALQDFITALIESFVSKGIDKLSSAFLKPYGAQPLLSEVKNQL